MKEQMYWIMVVTLTPCVFNYHLRGCLKKVHEEENWKWTFQNPWKFKLHVID
jgi:hypothetical protein